MALSAFKQMVREDSDKVFLNELEFADWHEVNGERMRIVIDSNELEEREKRLQQKVTPDGIYLRQLLFYVRAADYGRMPSIASYITLDKGKYRVTNAINEDGIYSIEVQAVRS